MTDRVRAIGLRLAVLAASLLLGLALVELGLRLLAPIPHSMEVEYIRDGHIGFRLLPNRTYQIPSGGTSSVNNLGYRGNRNISYRKPDGVFRIVALGGSSTFSYNTDDGRIWTTLLEERLRSDFGTRIEVVNAAVPGYNVFDSKIHYLYRVRDMQPDAVLVYHTWNDMKRFRGMEAGSAYRKGVPRRRALISFIKRFELAWRLRNFYETHYKPRWRETVYSESLDAPVQEISPGGRAHSWERQNYRDMANLLTTDGVLPVFISQGGLLAEENLKQPEIRAVVHAEMQGLNFLQILQQWQAVREITRSVAEQYDVPFIDGYSAVPHTLEMFSDHVHLTPQGNAVLADAVYRDLVADPRFVERVSASTERDSAASGL